MKLFSRTSSTFALGALLLGSTLAAQTAMSESGLIGKRHAGIEYTYLDYTGSGLANTRGASANFNVPLSSDFDLSFGYDYAKARGSDYNVSADALSASLLTYNRTEHGKAYFGGTIGHGWDRMKTESVSVRQNGAYWGVTAGYEVPINNRTAVNAGLTFTDAFNGSSTRNPTLAFHVEANHWFNSQLAGVVSASYLQIKRSPDAGRYTAGIRWAF